MAPKVSSHGDLVAARSVLLDLDFATGKYTPFVWPYNLLAFYLALAYLLLPPTKSRLYHYARYPIFAFNVYWCVGNILACRSHNPPMQYGIGLANAYACIWLAFHLIFRDTRTQSFKIIARKKSDVGDGSVGAHGGLQPIHEESTAVFSQSSALSHNDVTVRNRLVDLKPSEKILQQPVHPDLIKQEFYWQGLPDTSTERFYWICTMILCFRGEGTSHGVRQLPSPPQHVRVSLRHNSPRVSEPLWISDPRSTVYGFPTKRACIRHYLVKWAISYLILDTGKNLIERDPYFTGFVPITAPLPLPPSLVTSLPPSLHSLPSHPIFAQSCRLTLACAGILSLLTNLTSLPPLLFCWPGLVDYQPWSFPTTFGSDYAATLAAAGLAGWWGRWWHQMFRLSFSAPLESACRALRLRSKHGTAGQLLGMAIAFGLSGALHAAGSRTLNGDTRPWAGSGLFFLVQPVGIVLELGVRALGRGTGVARVLPGWVGTVLAFVWVHFWLYHTAPLLCDDVGHGGVWTTEVVPVSVVGGLLGRGWVRWKPWMFGHWHTGDRWWKSGIAL